MPRISAVACAAAVLLALPAVPHPAVAAGPDDVSDQWLPRSDGAEWTYSWSNSTYSPLPRTERYRLQARSGTTFRLRWQETGAGPYDVPSAGTLDFQHTDAGVVNLNYQSSQPPPAVPDPVRGARRVRQQPRRRDAPADLGHALTGAGRAAAARHAMGIAGRRRQRRRQREPLRRSRACQRAGVPGRDRGGEGRVPHHAGGGARGPVRQRVANRLVGSRRRAGEDRPRPRRRRGQQRRAAIDEPRAAAAAVRRRACCRSAAATGRRSAGATRGT